MGRDTGVTTMDRRRFGISAAAVGLVAQLLLPQAALANSATVPYNFSQSFTFNTVQNNVYRVRVVLVAGSACQTGWAFSMCDVRTNLTMTNAKWTSSNTTRLAGSSALYTLARCDAVLNRMDYVDPVSYTTATCGSLTTTKMTSGVSGLPEMLSADPPVWNIGILQRIQWGTYTSPLSQAKSSGSVTLTVPMSVSFYQSCSVPPAANVSSGASVRIFVESATSASGPWSAIAWGGNRLMGTTPIASDCAWKWGSGVFSPFLVP